MFTRTESIVINRCPAQVFPAVAAPEEQFKWDAPAMRSVEKVTPGPLAQGSRYRGTFKGFGTVEYEFAAFAPPQRFQHHARVKIGELRHTFLFEEVPEGTRFTQVGELQPNLWGRLLLPFMKPMLGQRLHEIATEVKHFVESDAVGAPS